MKEFFNLRDKFKKTELRIILTSDFKKGTLESQNWTLKIKKI